MDDAGRDPIPDRPSDEATHPLVRFVIAGALLAGLTASASMLSPLDPEYTRDYPSRVLPAEPDQEILPAEGPDEYYFPCSDCHEDEPTNAAVRELEDEHEDIALRHGDLWCLHCHDADDRDRLHLADRSTLEFSDSWELCVQCHGQQRRPWLAGIHGKRVGHWWGPREVWACVSCHAPHAPRFRPIEPEPPPKRPEQITLRVEPPTEEEPDE